MEDFTQSLPSFSSSFSGIVTLAASSSSASLDDSIEDSCSICFEPFSTDDPSSITNCKHEYHLHCILEWSQRRLECPICGRLLVLSDPSSQELLAPMVAARQSRTRNIASSMFISDSPENDSSDSDEEIMHHLMVMRRGQYVRRREAQISGMIAPRFLVLNSSPIPVAPSTITAGVDGPFDQRVIYDRNPAETRSRQNASESYAIPGSIKSKLTAASARYKESISKGTRGLKEKLLAYNSSVKELSKGVQREMSSSVARLVRMIERIELSSKRNATPSLPAAGFNGGSSSAPFKGKTGKENVSAQPRSKDSIVFI